MTLLIIFAALALFLFIKIKLSVVYSSASNVTLTLKVLFLRFRLHPKKLKKPKLRKFKKKRFDTVIEKKRRKELKKAERAERKKLKKKQAETEKTDEKPAKRSLLENISLIAELSGTVIRLFFRHLRIDAARIKITVASDDAAKTAIMYGFVSQAAAYLIEILENVSNFKTNRKSEISVACDYTAEKTDADIDISFSLRVYALLDIALRAAWKFLTKDTNKAEAVNINPNTNINNKRTVKKMGENKINDIIKTSLENLRSMVDANTVIGNAITTPNGTTVIPVSKVAAGFASGGLDYDGKKEAGTKPPNFGGGNGTGMSVTPVGFLIIAPDGSVELLNINNTPQSGTIEQIGDLVERSPEIIEKLKSVFKRNKDTAEEK